MPGDGGGDWVAHALTGASQDGEAFRLGQPRFGDAGEHGDGAAGIIYLEEGRCGEQGRAARDGRFGLLTEDRFDGQRSGGMVLPKC